MPKPKSKLNAKQLKFLDLYLRDFDPQSAYVEAGYASNNKDSAAFDLLRHPEIRKRIDEEHRKRRNEYRDIHANIIIKLQDIISSDADHFATWTEDTVRLIPSDVIPKHKRKAIAEINSLVVTSERDGDITTKVSNKLKLVDKIKAMELLAKITGALDADKEDPGAQATKNIVTLTLPAGTTLETEYDRPST